MPRLRLFALLILLPVAACGQKSASDDASTSSADATADTDFVEMCMESSNMGQELCDCVGRKAKANLSEKGHEFLIAMLLKRDDDMDRIRGDLSIPEAAAAGMIMVSAPRECAAELAGATQ